MPALTATSTKGMQPSPEETEHQVSSVPWALTMRLLSTHCTAKKTLSKRDTVPLGFSDE